MALKEQEIRIDSAGRRALGCETLDSVRVYLIVRSRLKSLSGLANNHRKIQESAQPMRRREFIIASGAAAAVQVGRQATAATSKPQVGDVLAHAFGEKAGSLIVAEEVADRLLFAFPMTPDGVLRSSSLHNQVVVLRVDEVGMSDKTQGYAAGPFVAISAACTHTGCEVSGWVASSSELECPCHGSRFDVLDAARVVNGPATRPLAYLPIELTDDVFRVAGKFSRRVGPPPVF